KMTLKRPDPVLPGKFAAMVVSGFAPAGADTKYKLATEMVGTGPFKLVEYQQNSHAIFQRNPSYWDAGLPYLDTLSVKFVPQEDTRIAALRAGSVDFCGVSADGARRLGNAPNLKTVTGAQGIFTVFKLNQRFKPFADVRVRRAMDLAIDRKD